MDDVLKQLSESLGCCYTAWRCVCRREMEFCLLRSWPGQKLLADHDTFHLSVVFVSSFFWRQTYRINSG